MAINVDWFSAKLRSAGLKNIAELARMMGMDKALMSRSLNGQRIFSVRDVTKIATLLRATTDEVVGALGYELPEQGVAVIGKITPDARVAFVGTRKGEKHVVPGAHADSKILIAEGLSGYDGAKFVYSPSEAKQPLPVLTLGQLAVVEADDWLAPCIGMVIRGNRNSLIMELLGTGERIPVYDIHSISPIDAIDFL